MILKYKNKKNTEKKSMRTSLSPNAFYNVWSRLEDQIEALVVKTRRRRHVDRRLIGDVT